MTALSIDLCNYDIPVAEIIPRDQARSISRNNILANLNFLRSSVFFYVPNPLVEQLGIVT
jgi:hypothetical protein